MYKKVYLLIVAVFVISAIIVPGSNVLAEYPDKPITMLIGFRPGGAVDTTARLVAKNLENSDVSVRFQNVTKKFGDFTAVSNVSFDIHVTFKDKGTNSIQMICYLLGFISCIFGVRKES